MSFLMQPNNIKNLNENNNYYIFKNNNGTRVFWDGGIKGIEVSWNVGELTTGLWNEKGDIIHAPKSWLESLPNIPEDGFLYNKLDISTDLNKIITKKKSRISNWENIIFESFDSPGLENVFQERDFIDIDSKNKLKNCAEKNNIKWEENKKFKLNRNIFTVNYLPWDQQFNKILNNLLKINKYGFYLRKDNSMYENCLSNNFLFYKEEI